jgi:hypothetical protein
VLAVTAALGQRPQHAHCSGAITRLPPEQTQALLARSGVGKQAAVEQLAASADDVLIDLEGNAIEQIDEAAAGTAAASNTGSVAAR